MTAFTAQDTFVDASPLKSFFVGMLTRDIDLGDAILDLLDNCVDGILRGRLHTATTETPYDGFFAEISFSKDSFSIHDNCGGIPWKLHEYAFKMGRSSKRDDNGFGTVGTYGIGMKRAIFKIGQECLISTRAGDDSYEVDISPDWMQDEKSWKIPVRPSTQTRDSDGTTIVIGQLYPGIANQLDTAYSTFEADLIKKISTHYAFIIAKGFKIKVNKEPVKGKPTKLLFDPLNTKKSIRPYIYQTEYDGVKVFLAVGFARPIPSSDDVTSEQDEPKYSSLDAGWTIICNDRAVLYCDRSELTGWGEAGVPQYHTQFIAVSGVVEFQSEDPSKLPTTTTKRGIDASSTLYLQIKNKMRDGMVLFTNYTNKWKHDVKSSKEHLKNTQAIPLSEVKKEAISLKMTTVAKGPGNGKQYKPSLPLPESEEQTARRISFVKESDDIRQVAEYLLNNPDASPSVVGERCFDEILREAAK